MIIKSWDRILKKSLFLLTQILLPDAELLERVWVSELRPGASPWESLSTSPRASVSSSKY